MFWLARSHRGGKLRRQFQRHLLLNTLKKRVLIVGCGYVGGAAADLFHAQGWEVFGWTHSEESAARLTLEKPYPVATCDITDAASVARAADRLPGGRGMIDVLIDCVSSGRGGGPEQYRRVYLDGARHLLAVFQPKRFVYTGSTSVYAQVDGSPVDESSPAAPERETGRILRETEESILDAGGTVARLAGIYGPGRSVLLRKFLAGEAVIEGDGSRWINQIHRDDAAAALYRLAQADAPTGVYNVADDAPLRQRDLYQALAEGFARSLPPIGPEDRNRKRGWTSKQVLNGKLRALGWQPDYPCFLDWAMDQPA